MKSTHGGLLTEIMEKKLITMEIESSITAGMDEFLGLHEFEAKAS